MEHLTTKIDQCKKNIDKKIIEKYQTITNNDQKSINKKENSIINSKTGSSKIVNVGKVNNINTITQNQNTNRKK